MADNAFSDSDQQLLFEQFEQLENQEKSSQKKSDFIKRITLLEQIYN